MKRRPADEDLREFFGSCAVCDAPAEFAAIPLCGYCFLSAAGTGTMLPIGHESGNHKGGCRNPECPCDKKHLTVWHPDWELDDDGEAVYVG